LEAEELLLQQMEFKVTHLVFLELFLQVVVEVQKQLVVQQAQEDQVVVDLLIVEQVTLVQQEIHLLQTLHKVIQEEVNQVLLQVQIGLELVVVEPQQLEHQVQQVVEEMVELELLMQLLILALHMQVVVAEEFL
jgi:hypothetical protein